MLLLFDRVARGKVGVVPAPAPFGAGLARAVDDAGKWGKAWSGELLERRIEHMFEAGGGDQEEAAAAAAGPWIDPFTDQPMPRPRASAERPGGDRDADAAPGAGRFAPVHPLVADLQAAVSALARAQVAAAAASGAAFGSGPGCGGGSVTGGSLVDTAALLRAAESVAGLALVEVAAVDRTRSYAGAGRASTAGWLGATLTIAEPAARAKVALARRLTEDLQPVGDLLVDGGTTVAHCTAMATGLRGIGPDVVADSSAALVTLARTLDPPTLCRELRERALAISPELAREQERRQRQRVGCTASELPDGCVSVQALLAPEPGQALLAALDALVHAHRQARTEDGQVDDRDAATRRADALADLAQHALGCDGLLPGQGGNRAVVHVVVDAETLLSDEPGARPATFPASNALLTRQQLLRLSCDADISRVTVTDVGSRQVLDLGRLTRTVTRGQYRALVARDQGCVIRGCRRRHSECQAHHVQHWTLGGPSDLANYALICHLHHHQLHEGQRTLQHRDGRWLTPSGYRDPGPEPPF